MCRLLTKFIASEAIGGVEIWFRPTCSTKTIGFNLPPEFTLVSRNDRVLECKNNDSIDAALFCERDRDTGMQTATDCVVI